MQGSWPGRARNGLARADWLGKGRRANTDQDCADATVGRTRRAYTAYKRDVTLCDHTASLEQGCREMETTTGNAGDAGPSVLGLTAPSERPPRPADGGAAGGRPKDGVDGGQRQVFACFRGLACAV